MKAYAMAYSASAVWLALVYAVLSDYRVYKTITAGTWGFIIVEGLTLLPILAILFAAELLRKASAKKASDG